MRSRGGEAINDQEAKWGRGFTSIQGHGPYPVEDDHNLFASDVAGRKGVYIWGVPTATGWLVDFVGETGRSFKQRLEEHRRDPEAYELGQRVLVWKGWQQFGKPSEATLEAARVSFRFHSERLEPIAQALLRLMGVVLLPIDGDAVLRQRIEHAMIEALLADPVAKAFFDNSIRHPLFQPASEPLTVRFQLTVPIIGLSEMLEV